MLLCSVFVLLRVGGTHWHLCFDGREPAVSIHLADSSFEHSATGVESQHHDQNVEIGLASLLKHGSADFDIPPVLIVAFLFAAAVPKRALPRARRTPAPPWSGLSLLLPPLRGPPEIAIS